MDVVQVSVLLYVFMASWILLALVAGFLWAA